MTEDQFRFVPEGVAVVPPNGLLIHYKDYWWVVHPEKGLAFYWRGFGNGSGQCNQNEAIVRKLAQSYPWATVKFIPSAFFTIDPRDYA